jgi:WD40 repeat protein
MATLTSVTSVAISSDGTYVLSQALGMSLCECGMHSSGAQLKVLNGHTNNYVTSVAFSSDGTPHCLRILGSSLCGCGMLQVGHQLKVLNGHTHYVTSVAFSSDGTSHCLRLNGTSLCEVWDASSGDQLKVLNGHTDHVTSVAISSDGTSHCLRVLMMMSVRVWDASQWDSAERCYDGHTGTLSVLLPSPVMAPTYCLRVLGQVCACCGMPQVGISLMELNGHTQDVTSVAFSSDGTQIASGSQDESVRVWDAFKWD